MMSKLRLVTFSALTGAILCGFTGAVFARGTSVLLPGLGLVIAGSFAAGLICGFIGLILGSIIGLFASLIIKRRSPFP